MTKNEVMTTIWLTNAPLPQEYCDQIPELKKYGFYRKLKDGKIEFVSYCKKESRAFIAIPESQFYELLERAFPEPRETN